VRGSRTKLHTEGKDQRRRRTRKTGKKKRNRTDLNPSEKGNGGVVVTPSVKHSERGQSGFCFVGGERIWSRMLFGRPDKNGKI